MLLLVLACSATDSSPTPSDPATPSTPIPTEPTGDTGWVEPPTPGPAYRPEQLACTEVPPFPEAVTPIQGLGSHEDFAFDAQGRLVGVTGGNLVAHALDGSTELLAPQVGTDVKGVQYNGDGTIALARWDTGHIDRIHADGQREVLASVTSPNGLAVDLHGHVWSASTAGALTRVAPDGSQQVYAQFLGTSMDGITFSPDYRRLYFNSEYGIIRYLDLDDDGIPLDDEPQQFVTVPLAFGVGVLDGMTTDACGNLYAVRMDGKVFRFRPDGTPAGVLSVGSIFTVTPSLNFGSGMGGFERDHLYVMSFLDGVFEVDVGIEGRWEPHYPVP